MCFLQGLKHFGISINDHQPDSALGIIETGLIDTVQVIYNIYDQSPQINLFGACKRHNIGVLARCPLDEGSLTGAVTDAATVADHLARRTSSVSQT